MHTMIAISAICLFCFLIVLFYSQLVTEYCKTSFSSYVLLPKDYILMFLGESLSFSNSHVESRSISVKSTSLRTFSKISAPVSCED